MTLTERLEVARQATTRSARLETARAESETSNVVELSPVATDAHIAAIDWTEATDCPACGDAGAIDLVDLVAGRTRQHCESCGHAWELRR